MSETKEENALKTDDERWLANYIERARNADVISNEDLLKVFPPDKLFTSYEEEPRSRAKLLIGCIQGFGQATAENLDIATCIALVNKALEMKDVTADTIYGVISPSEIVRTQDRKELWTLLDEKHWPEQDTTGHRELMGFMLEAYVEHQLDGGQVRSLKTIEQRLEFANYVEHLPKEILVEVLIKAREVADANPGNIPFTADVLSSIVTPSLLAKHLPLPILYRVLEGAAEKFEWMQVAEPVVDEVIEVEASELSEHKEASSIPEEALDSILPTEAPEAPSDDDPELEFGYGSDSIPPNANDEAIVIVDEDGESVEEEADEDKTNIVENPIASGKLPSLPTPSLSKRSRSKNKK